MSLSASVSNAGALFFYRVRLWSCWGQSDYLQPMPDFQCRPGCGACCIALSISSAIPGLPNGKAAGERCVQLADDFRCRIFGQAGRPACCGGLRPDPEMCGNNRDEALAYLYWLDSVTRAEA
jgi:hypothetical protein